MQQIHNTTEVAGAFNSAGGVANTQGIAKWNVTNWSALGTGINSTQIYALATQDNNLYVGGSFSSADGIPNANNIAKWDGTNWSASYL